MANAAKDQNGVSTLIGALEDDGRTPTRVTASPTNHGVMIDDDTTGTDHGPVNDIRDENSVTGLMAVSADDGVTPVVVYVNADGHLLIDSS